MTIEDMVSLPVDGSARDRFFSVAPLVVIGTRFRGQDDLAPKHMATPVGWGDHFGFMCTPKHTTYHNIKEQGEFTVSYPRPDQVVVASLSASGPGTKEPVLDAIPTADAVHVGAPFVSGAYAVLECRLDRIVDELGDGSFIVGRIIGAHVARDALRTGEDDDADLLRSAPLLVYLDPGRWAQVTEALAFPFPAGFKV